MSNYGYGRVSSADQNEARQIISLCDAGCARIFVDKQSGKDFERPEYKKMLRLLREGDVVFIHSLDRLGRNYELIKSQWAHIVNRKKAHIVVMDMPILDTRQGQGLIGKFLSDIVLQLLAFVAQQERDSIRKRQAEGIAAAKLRGVKFGRVTKPLPENFFEIWQIWKNGEISGTEAARRLGMPQTTFYFKSRKLAEKSAPGAA